MRLDIDTTFVPETIPMHSVSNNDGTYDIVLTDREAQGDTSCGRATVYVNLNGHEVGRLIGQLMELVYDAELEFAV